MEIFASLIDWVKDIGEDARPWFIVNQYDHVITLRFGRFNKLHEPGLHFKIPFADNVLSVRKSVKTLNIQPQTLTTKDGKTIVLSAVIKFKVVDPEKYFIEVDDPIDAVGDISQSKIKSLVMSKTWEEVKAMKDADIKAKMLKDAEEFGLQIQFITITTMAEIKTYRLIQA